MLMLRKYNKVLWIVLFSAIVLLALSSFLAWVSNGFAGVNGWKSFFAIGIAGEVLYCFTLRVFAREKVPGWLIGFLLGVVLLRLALGVVLFAELPEWGYGTKVERAGYVMSDAYERDTTAWLLAHSDKPLTSAFHDYRKVDQYGGLLFLSAAVYRYLGGEVHQPLLMVLLVSLFSSLTVLFTWGFVRRLWGYGAAAVAAGVAGLFPDAILVGGSQMREAFTMTLAAMVVYGFVLVWQEKSKWGMGLIIGVLVGSLFLSPFFTVMLLIVLGLLALFVSEWRVLRDWRFWAGILLALVVLLGLVWAFGEKLLPGFHGNAPEILSTWFKYATKWQLYLSQRASGWIQKVLRSTPGWSHVFLLLVYGIVRPFLPAALVATGQPVWKAIAVFRAAGWTLLLPVLVYTFFRSIFTFKKQRVAAALSIAIWLILIIASLRGGGDQWDNPRYRLSLICLQAAMAGWVWMQNRRKPDLWLRRIVLALFAVFLWFVPWYLRRYTQLDWPVQDVFKTLGLGIVSAVLLWIWDWMRLKKKRNER